LPCEKTFVSNNGLALPDGYDFKIGDDNWMCHDNLQHTHDEILS